MAKIHCHSLLSGSSWSSFEGDTSEDEPEGKYDHPATDLSSSIWQKERICRSNHGIMWCYFSVFSYGSGRKQYFWSQ